MYSSKLFFAVVDFDEGQDVFATVRNTFKSKSCSLDPHVIAIIIALYCCSF